MNWIEKSRNIGSLNLEVCFQLQESFYIGDPNSLEQLQDEKYRELVELPSFQCVVPAMARTSEAIESTNELASYYKNIIEKSVVLGKPFNEIRQYFWLRLWLWNTEEDVHISFPWYDSLSEIQQFFSWLKGNPEEPYIDIDQGWKIDAVVIGKNIHIRQIDPDCNEEYSNVSVPFEKFLQQASEVENRAQQIIRSLSKELGVDVWSKYLKDAIFGTEEWQPNKKINRTKIEEYWKAYIKYVEKKPGIGSFPKVSGIPTVLAALVGAGYKTNLPPDQLDRFIKTFREVNGVVKLLALREIEADRIFRISEEFENGGIYAKEVIPKVFTKEEVAEKYREAIFPELHSK